MRPALALALSLLLALAAACGGGGDDSKGGDDGDATLSTATITLIGGAGKRAELTVELAVTPGERSRGLMFRESLAEERGMLFVFAQETKAGFWMKNTKIPLSIAFIASDGLILETQDMEPLSEELHTPARAYRYALEVNQGWFERHGLGLGDRVEIPADARRE
ncbi:MAG: DUF192 domain-containing protein [Dehalococcoidia bacterium]|nr:DUF192 domain-containing protein [Dehalococcoidia bacterium]